MSWTNPITWFFQQVWSASLFNQQIRDNLNYLKNRPYDLALLGTTDQTGVTTAWVAVTNSAVQIVLPVTAVLEFGWRIHVHSTTAAARFQLDIFDVDNGVYLSSGTATPTTNGLGQFNTNATASVGSSATGSAFKEAVSAGTHNYQLYIKSSAAATTVENSDTKNAFWVKEVS